MNIVVLINIFRYKQCVKQMLFLLLHNVILVVIFLVTGIMIFIVFPRGGGTEGEGERPAVRGFAIKSIFIAGF